MPSSATITSFYNFSANTKARASQVNNNFDVFRGHIIPVEPLTATSADNTYDLGDFSHRWRYGYFGQTRYGTTSTAYGSVQLASDTTAAELILSLNGTEKARINTNGIKFTSIPFKLTTTSFDFSSIAGVGATTSISGIDISRPVNINFLQRDITTTSDCGTITFTALTTSTVGPVAIYVKRDSTIIHGLYFSSVASASPLRIPISALNCIDTSATTTPVYSLVSTGTAGYLISANYNKMIVYQ